MILDEVVVNESDHSWKNKNDFNPCQETKITSIKARMNMLFSLQDNTKVDKNDT